MPSLNYLPKQTALTPTAQDGPGWLQAISFSPGNSETVYGHHFFFFQAEDGIRDLTVTGVQTCALPIFLALLRVEPVVVRVGLHSRPLPSQVRNVECGMSVRASNRGIALRHRPCNSAFRDRKSTRLNSSHSQISYAVFCLKKKKIPAEGS